MRDTLIAETKDVDTNSVKIAARGVQVYYADNHAIKDVDVDIEDKTVTAFIGPVRLRQVDVPALYQPDERHHRHLPGGRGHQDRRGRYLSPRR